MRPLKLTALLLLIAIPAWAVEQECWTVSEPVVACDGRDGIGHGGVMFSPPAWAPPLPLALVRVSVWTLGACGQGGNASVALDPGSLFVTYSGYPASQAGTAPGEALLQRIITLAGTNASANSRFGVATFDPPVVWHPGDALYTNFAGAGGGFIQMGWSLCWAVDTRSPLVLLPSGGGVETPPVSPPPSPPPIPPTCVYPQGATPAVYVGAQGGLWWQYADGTVTDMGGIRVPLGLTWQPAPLASILRYLGCQP